MSTNPMLWVGYPKSYTPGRNRAPRLIVWHHTAGSEGPTSAEAGADYDKRRTDGTSCHAFFDSLGPGLQEVPFGDRAHTAMHYGNEIGVNFELCGTLQTREQWLDPTSLATLTTAAIAGRYTGETLSIAPKRLSDAEVRRAWDVGDVTGHCDHWAITRVFGQGDHTDVGPHFPWDVFMPMIAGTAPLPIRDEDDMRYIRQQEDGRIYEINGLIDPRNGMPVLRVLTEPAEWEERSRMGYTYTNFKGTPDWRFWTPFEDLPPDTGGGGDATLVPHIHDLNVPHSTLATGPAQPTT